MENLEEYWQNCLQNIQQELGDFTYMTWFKDLKIISLKNDNLVIQASDKFYIEHINSKYLSFLTTIVEQNFKKPLKLKLLLEEEIKNINYSNSDVSKDNTTENNLNNSYIFENFVIGESNRLAHAASVAVAESPGIYNPLFLYGDVGLGKTHLMHAIANFILYKNRNAKVLYASCEKFTNELIASIREQKNKEFREKYRKIDVLLIDDIQFIVDKTQTQEEFFHTFNDLKDSGKQIIISSDRPPNEIETLTERLRSRFSGGLIADIKAPTFETRTAILEKKAESLNISIPKEVSQFIAKSVKSNIRELEGALTRVIAYSNLTNVKLSVELAENALKDIIQDKDNYLNQEKILEIVANHFNVKLEELKSKKRNQPITNARQIYMYLSREILNESLLNIGKAIDRDHSTVIHGIEKIEIKIKNDKSFEETILTLKEKILKK